MDDMTRVALAAQYAKITADLEELENQRGIIRGMFAEEGKGTRAAGTLQVVVTVPRKLDMAAFSNKYPVTEFPGYYESKPRTAMAKALDDPTVYVDGTTTVRVVDAG